jgi:hypothetical protein
LAPEVLNGGDALLRGFAQPKLQVVFGAVAVQGVFADDFADHRSIITQVVRF